MNIIAKAKERPVLTSVAAFCVSVAAIISGTQAIGIKIIPWASAGDIKAMEDKLDERDEKILDLIEQLQAEQKSMSKDQRALMRDFWQKKLEEADEELRQNPLSRTARKQHNEAKAALDSLDRAEVGSPHP